MMLRYMSTLSLHDALPIFGRSGEIERAGRIACRGGGLERRAAAGRGRTRGSGRFLRDDAPFVARARRQRARIECRIRGRKLSDRKSTRLNSSHEWISYAVF